MAIKVGQNPEGPIGIWSKKLLNTNLYATKEPKLCWVNFLIVCLNDNSLVVSSRLVVQLTKNNIKWGKKRIHPRDLYKKYSKKLLSSLLEGTLLIFNNFNLVIINRSDLYHISWHFLYFHNCKSLMKRKNHRDFWWFEYYKQNASKVFCILHISVKSLTFQT